MGLSLTTMRFSSIGAQVCRRGSQETRKDSVLGGRASPRPRGTLRLADYATGNHAAQDCQALAHAPSVRCRALCTRYGSKLSRTSAQVRNTIQSGSGYSTETRNILFEGDDAPIADR